MDIWVFFAPCIPGVHALLEQSDVLMIGHWVIQVREAVRRVTIAVAVAQRLGRG
jgi:hypothetical protein